MSGRKILIVTVVVSLMAAVAIAGLGRLVVYELSRPKPSDIPNRNKIGSFPIEQVTFTADDGVAISGWLIRSLGTRAVILLHGLGGNRLQHIPKTELYTAGSLSPD